MSLEFVLLIFNYSIVPFVSAIILFFLVLKGYRKLKYRYLCKHDLDLLVVDLDKQARMQAGQIEQILNQLDLVYEKIDKTEKKIKEIQEIKNLLEERVQLINDERIKSHFSVTSPIRNYLSSSNDVLDTYNHNKKSHNHVHLVQDDERRNGTIEYILKKLEDTSLSTKEIQLMIGRTREHTSRLMKKLYEEDLVEREISNKPFRYTITDEGRRRLSKHSSLNIHYHSEHQNSENSTDRLIENQ